MSGNSSRLSTRTSTEAQKVQWHAGRPLIKEDEENMAKVMRACNAVHKETGWIIEKRDGPLLGVGRPSKKVRPLVFMKMMNRKWHAVRVPLKTVIRRSDRKFVQDQTLVDVLLLHDLGFPTGSPTASQVQKFMTDHFSESDREPSSNLYFKDVPEIVLECTDYYYTLAERYRRKYRSQAPPPPLQPDYRSRHPPQRVASPPGVNPLRLHPARKETYDNSPYTFGDLALLGPRNTPERESNPGLAKEIERQYELLEASRREGGNIQPAKRQYELALKQGLDPASSRIQRLK